MKTLHLVLALGLLMPATAWAGKLSDDDTRCIAFIDHVAGLVRTGQTARAKRAGPKLRQCESLLRASQMKAAQKLVGDYDAQAVRNPAPAPR